jgi:prepilin-type N-terminal cleavage/methylation domain-containing protein
MRIWIAATSRELEAGGWRLVSFLSRSFKARISVFASQAASRKPQAAKNAGFTLLELAVVLLIVGLLITVAVPRFPDLTGARLESSARRLAALVRYLSGEAAFRSHLYRLHYDLDQQSYWVTVLTTVQDTAEFIVDEAPLSRPVQLPPSIMFADVRVPDVGRVNRGQVYTHFYPHGYIDPTVIHLRDQSSRVLTVVIPPLTGEARIYEGYVEPFPVGTGD